jgi:hypothetical protein
MVSKANYTGFINGIMKFVIFCLCLSMFMSDASIAFVVAVPLYQQH